MNLTDEQVIKALECCVKDDEGVRGSCNKNCPLFGSDVDCTTFLRRIALDLINRKDKVNKLSAKEIVDLKIKLKEQQAEIERRRAKCNLPKEGFFNVLCGALVYTKTLEEYNQFRRTIKVEAIKEFAERLKEHTTTARFEQGKYSYEIITAQSIDNLVKEMTE